MLAMASSHPPHGDPWGHRPAFLEPQLHHSGPPSSGSWPAPVENRTLPSIDTARGRPWEQQRSASNSPKTQQLPSVRSLLNPEQAPLPPPQPSHRPVHSAGSVANNPHPLSLPSPPIPGLPSFRAMTSATYPTPAPTSSPRASDAPYTHFGSHHPHPTAAQEQRSPRDNESVSGPRSTSASRRRGGGGNRAPVRISRCIGQRHVPGEGLCFVYEDGSFCRTNIDGEPVNPSWGVTKAGKPRKRLAQACLTCREKKIKCEPSAGSKCVQCTKARRLCRGIHDQSSDQDPVSRSANPSKRRMTDFNSPSGGIAFLEDAAINQQGYRLKDMYEKHAENQDRQSLPARASADIDMEDRPKAVTGPAILSAKESSFLASQQRYAAAWESDPYEDDADLTMRYLDLYFIHINAATYCMLPKDLFLRWVQTCNSKSADDRMLLYVLMTMGSVFSFRPEDAAIRQQLAKISTYAVERRSGHYSIQLAMSRLIMSLFNFARGKAFDAWDLNGAAYRSVSAVMYNMEDGIRQFMETKPAYEFGFDRTYTEEVRRRVYWSAFIMDRYNGFCGGNLLAISSDDTYLQLPGPEASFEHGEVVTGPLYDPDIPIFEPEAALSIGSQGHLAMISSIWGDVFTFTARTSRRLPKDFAKLYEDYCVTTQQRAERWLAQLPQSLRWSVENLDASIEGGYAGLYISLYALYHITFLRLYRHTNLAQLSPQLVCRNIIRLRQHARAWTAIMCDMRKKVRDQRLAARRSDRGRSATAPPCETTASAADARDMASSAAATQSHPPVSGSTISRASTVVPSVEGSETTDFIFSTPFSGYTFLLSVDALTAGGRMRNLPELKEQLQAALDTVEELAQFWTAARAQVRAIRKRLEKLDEVLARDEEERQQILEGETRAGRKQEAEASPNITDEVPMAAADDENSEAVIDPRDLPPCWRLDAPLETAYAKSDDVMYGTPDAVFFRAALDEELLAL